MRLHEITPSNKSWSDLGDNNRLRVMATYLQLSTMFDRLNQGFNFPNNTKIWNNYLETFNEKYSDGIEYLDGFPNQHDQFIDNFKASFETMKNKISLMTDKLRQSGKIT